MVVWYDGRMSKKNGKDHHEGEMERKFSDFDKMVSVAKRDGVQVVLVPSPQTLGDTYEELIRKCCPSGRFIS
jgi:hypothetical protein